MVLMWTPVLIQTWSWCGPCSWCGPWSWCKPSPGVVLSPDEDSGPDADSGTGIGPRHGMDPHPGVDPTPGAETSPGAAGCLLATLLTVLAPPPLILHRSQVASSSNHGLLTSCLYLQSAGDVLVNYRCHTSTNYLGFFSVESPPNLFPFSSAPPLIWIELIVLILVHSSLAWGQLPFYLQIFYFYLFFFDSVNISFTYLGCTIWKYVCNYCCTGFLKYKFLLNSLGQPGALLSRLALNYRGHLCLLSTVLKGMYHHAWHTDSWKFQNARSGNFPLYCPVFRISNGHPVRRKLSNIW